LAAFKNTDNPIPFARVNRGSTLSNEAISKSHLVFPNGAASFLVKKEEQTARPAP
jgi:hypothetical protein